MEGEGGDGGGGGGGGFQGIPRLFEYCDFGPFPQLTTYAFPLQSCVRGLLGGAGDSHRLPLLRLPLRPAEACVSLPLHHLDSVHAVIFAKGSWG